MFKQKRKIMNQKEYDALKRYRPIIHIVASYMLKNMSLLNSFRFTVTNYSVGDNIIAIGCQSGDIRLVQSDGYLIKSIDRTHNFPIISIKMNESSSLIVYLSEYLTCVCVKTAQVLWSNGNRNGSNEFVFDFLPDGKHLLVYDCKSENLDVRITKTYKRICRYKILCTHFVFSKDKNFIIIKNESSIRGIFNVSSHKLKRVFINYCDFVEMSSANVLTIGFCRQEYDFFQKILTFEISVCNADTDGNKMNTRKKRIEFPIACKISHYKINSKYFVFTTKINRMLFLNIYGLNDMKKVHSFEIDEDILYLVDVISLYKDRVCLAFGKTCVIYSITNKMSYKINISGKMFEDEILEVTFVSDDTLLVRTVSHKTRLYRYLIK